MENNLPTAEEFLDNYINKNNIPWNPDIEKLYGAINICMIEFTKLHCESALKAKIQAMKEYMNDGYSLDEIDAFTYNAYPLTNIK